MPGPAALIRRPARQVPRLGLVLGLVCGLAGCVPGYGAGRKVAILDGTLQVGMAAGYCIDKAASRERDNAAVILMGRCNSAVPELPAVLNLTVGPAGSGGGIAGGTEALDAFFRSEAGRATLSREGRADDITLLQTAMADSIFTMRVRDAAVGEYWRAITSIRGRLVTLSAAGTATTPLDPARGKTILNRAMAELIRANAAPAG